MIDVLINTIITVCSEVSHRFTLVVNLTIADGCWNVSFACCEQNSHCKLNLTFYVLLNS